MKLIFIETTTITVQLITKFIVRKAKMAYQILVGYLMSKYDSFVII